MPLTPSDVHDKQFKLVRQTTGYDMDEVDGFLDEVEFEIGRLTTELTEAQVALAESRNALSASEDALAGTRAELDQVRAQLAAALDQPPVTALAAPVPQPVVPQPVVTQPSESSTLAAARLLELAQRTADEHIAQATVEAEQIVAEARGRAEQAMAGLTDQQAEVEQRVRALQGLQDDIRTRLRGYLENQLRELSNLDEPAGEAG